MYGTRYWLPGSADSRFFRILSSRLPHSGRLLLSTGCSTVIAPVTSRVTEGLTSMSVDGILRYWSSRELAAAGSASRVQFQSYAEAYDEDFEDVRRRVPDMSRLRETISYRNQHDLDGIIQSVIQHQQAGGEMAGEPPSASVD